MVRNAWEVTGGIDDAVDEIYDLLNIAARKHPLKKVAHEIQKKYPTLRNELGQVDGYKLGIKTFIRLICATGDTSALDRVETIFNRVAFDIPEMGNKTPVEIMQIIADLSKEYSESIMEVSKSLEDDGKISDFEIDNCLKETDDLIKKALNLKMYLLRML